MLASGVYYPTVSLPEQREDGHLSSENLFHSNAHDPLLKVLVTSEDGVSIIFRDDARETITPLAERLYATNPHSFRRTPTDALCTLYEERFCPPVIDEIVSAYAQHRSGSIQAHVYDSRNLGRAMQLLSGDETVISLTPVGQTGENVLPLRISRRYSVGGGSILIHDGYPEASSQIPHLIEGIKGENPNLIVRDEFSESGRTFLAVRDIFAHHNVTVDQFVVGVQIGDHANLAGLNISPAVSYEIHPNHRDATDHNRLKDGRDISDIVQVGDLRDFLLGGFGSGLGIQLPSGAMGRCPTILPFMSPHTHYRVDPQIEVALSAKVLELNKKFFREVKNSLGVEVCLQHMDPAFRQMMNELYGFTPNDSMNEIVNWASRSMCAIWAYNKKIGARQKLEKLSI